MDITDAMIKKSCSATMYKRGMEYFREGRVHLRKRGDNFINAVVDGDEIYNVQVKFDKNGITGCMCTCPYFQTMNSVCKHIVAAMKQRQTEIEEGGSYVDENDQLAQMLCGEYMAQKNEKETLYPAFVIYINTSAKTGTSCSVAMMFNGSALHGIENFLDSYISGREFKIDRSLSYIPGKTEFGKYHREVVDILAEGYENRSGDSKYYHKAAYRTPIGVNTLGRILPYIKYVDFSLFFDAIDLGAVQIKEENPDILIDVNALDNEITMTVSERGFALTRDGEWFFYENAIYHTDEEWRGYFMPIYRALAVESRTYIAFRGANRISFASEVLPAIEGRRGVVTQGLDEVIVNEKPSFEIYFDAFGERITAAVIASYGSISMTLPGGENTSSKVVVRDFEAENDILYSFEGFSRDNGRFVIDDDDRIYDFITLEIPILQAKAKLYMSDRFKAVSITNDIDLKVWVDYNRETDLLEAEFETDLSYSEIREILKAVRLRRKFFRLKDGRFLDIAGSMESSPLSVMASLDFTDKELKAGAKSLPKYNALYLDALDKIKKREGFDELIRRIKNTEAVFPEHLKDILRGYQKTGIAWMRQLSMLGLGGVLADDMGLGKTLQVIAFFMGEKPKRPALIVAPSALLYNWYNEIQTFTPEARVLIADGEKSAREKDIRTAMDYDFVITSYPLLRRDAELYKEISFSYCFIDEAQNIKNPKTMNALSVKNVRADIKFALTGTPVENSLLELWSIFDYVMKGFLYSAAEFKRRYEIPITKEGDAGASRSLRTKIKPFILRRMKDEVLYELPEKIENTMYAELVPEQKQLYASYLATAKDRTLSLLQDGSADGKFQILTLLTRLRQICCHPALFDTAYKNESGKLEMLMDIIDSAIDSGHRLLIFSQFTSMLNIIEKKLSQRKIEFFRLDGSTKPYDRMEMSEQFNLGQRSVFLISLKAGGTGLNLTGADMVVHYDPWWNPAVMDQATDRAYRIGQKRAVQVIRLVSRGTIEEKIIRLQESKRSLADDIIRVNNNSLSSLTNEEIISLFE